MSKLLLIPVDREGLAPRSISPRLRSQLVYFAAPPGAAAVPALGENEIFFLRHEVERWLEDGVIELVSPLDTDNMTEVELEEEQESLLAWIKTNDAWRLRISE